MALNADARQVIGDVGAALPRYDNGQTTNCAGPVLAYVASNTFVSCALYALDRGEYLDVGVGGFDLFAMTCQLIFASVSGILFQCTLTIAKGDFKRRLRPQSARMAAIVGGSASFLGMGMCISEFGIVCLIAAYLLGPIVAGIVTTSPQLKE